MWGLVRLHLTLCMTLRNSVGALDLVNEGRMAGSVGLAQALTQTEAYNTELLLHHSWSFLVMTFGSGLQAMLSLPPVYFLHESLVLAQWAVDLVS